MGGILGNAIFKQSVVDLQETDDNWYNIIDSSNSTACSSDHEDADERVRKILVEQVSSDWMRFAHIVCLNAFYDMVEKIQKENNNNELKLKKFLRRLMEINPLNFYEVIANCLYTLKRFDILLCVAFNEKFSKVKKFLIEHLSTDWKRFAYETHLIDIVTIVKQIDQDNKDDKSRMASFLENLFEIEPFQYKDKIRNALITLGKLDILFGVALDENYETVKCILIESVSTDWKRFAHCTYLHDIDSVVEQIDCGYSNNQSKMAAFIDKLYELDPLNYKKLIVNSLNVASRFDALFRLALFESNEIVLKLLVEDASSDWKKFAIYTCLYEVNSILENIDLENNSNQMKMKALLEKLYDINSLQFKELIKSTLITMKKFSVLSAFEEEGCLRTEKEEKEKLNEEISKESALINDEQLIVQLDTESGKTVVFIPIDHNLSEPAPSPSFNTGLPRHGTLNDYSAVDNDEEKVVLKDQAKMGNILDNSELLLQLKTKIGKDWINMGRFLSVSDNELDVIDTENNDGLEEKAYRMLCAWKNQQKFPTLEALASAMYKINRLDLIKVMEKLSNKSFERENPLKPSIAEKENAEQQKDDSMSNTWQIKANYEQLHNDTNTSLASYLDHEGTDAKVKNVIIEKVTDWKRFARLTNFSNNVNGIVEQIDHDVTGGDKSKLEKFLTKLVELHPNDYITYLQKSLKSMGRNDLYQCIASIYAEQQKIYISKALKTHYLKIYKTTEQLVHKMITPIDVELSDKFVELTLVDGNEVERDAVNNSERKYFLQKHLSYERISLQEVLSENPSLLLISGIAGIGKTWYLKKCLLDWAKGLIWKNVDLVFFLECRQLNLFENIGSVDELLNLFYKDVLEGFNISPYLSMLFVVDGLDEFFWLNELLEHDSKNLSQYPIVNALADTLNFDKAKCVIAGRVGAISKYKYTVWNKKDKLIIQIMGFNNDGINDYLEKNTNKNQIESVNNVLQESYAAKAMASVPFCLAVMCAIITSTSEKYYSFNTMTELYCCIFIYFLQKHINKKEEPIWKMMESASVKENIYRICKIAFELLNQGKVIFTDSEMKQMGNFDNHDNDKVFGFIEKIESHVGYRYQFVHLTLMEFRASVHAYICLTPSQIMSIQSLLPMICGLTNRDSSCFVNFIAKMKKSREEEHSLLLEYLNLVPQSFDFSDVKKMFMECFFEAQASITGEIKRSIDKRKWIIDIGNRKTAHEVSHEKYFMKKFFDAGCKLKGLHVNKKILSEDEKKLVILCSTNVHRVVFWCPVKIDGWTPIHKIESLEIYISDTFLSKNEFEGFVLPWIRLAEELHLELHDDTNFIDDICEWLRGSNFKRLTIRYRGKHWENFYNIEELKERNT